MLFTLMALAQEPVTFEYESRVVVHDSIDFLSWWTDRTVNFETPPNVRTIEQLHEGKGLHREPDSIRWTGSRPRTEVPVQLLAFVSALENVDVYMSPKSEWTYGFRPVRTADDPDCDFETCPAIEIYVQRPGWRSPLDVNLELPAGWVPTHKIVEAYEKVAGRGFGSMSNGNPFPSASYLPPDATFRMVLNQVCHLRCSWTYIHRAKSKKGEWRDTIHFQTRGGQWAEGAGVAGKMERSLDLGLAKPGRTITPFGTFRGSTELKYRQPETHR